MLWQQLLSATTALPRGKAGASLHPTISGLLPGSLAPSCTLCRAVQCRCSKELHQALCAAGLMLLMGDAGVQIPGSALCNSFLIISFPSVELLEIWLPKLLQSAPQPAVLTAHGSPSTFKIRSLSDVHSTTFDSYMSKAERERRVYPLEQESWK